MNIRDLQFNRQVSRDKAGNDDVRSLRGKEATDDELINKASFGQFQ